MSSASRKERKKSIRSNGATSHTGAPLSHNAGTHSVTAHAHAKRRDGGELSLKVETRSPFPPPEIVRQYEAIAPGLGKQLVEEGFKQGEHRRKQENRVLLNGIYSRWAGLLLGGVLAYFVIDTGAKLTMADHDTVGGILMNTTVLGLACIFVLGRTIQKSERVKKSRIMARVLDRILPDRSSQEEDEGEAVDNE